MAAVPITDSDILYDLEREEIEIDTVGLWTEYTLGLRSESDLLNYFIRLDEDPNVRIARQVELLPPSDVTAIDFFVPGYVKTVDSDNIISGEISDVGVSSSIFQITFSESTNFYVETNTTVSLPTDVVSITVDGREVYATSVDDNTYLALNGLQVILRYTKNDAGGESSFGQNFTVNW